MLDSVGVIIDHRFHRRVYVADALQEVFERRLLGIFDFALDLGFGFILQHSAIVQNRFRRLQRGKNSLLLFEHSYHRHTVPYTARERRTHRVVVVRLCNINLAKHFNLLFSCLTPNPWWPITIREYVSWCRSHRLWSFNCNCSFDVAGANNKTIVIAIYSIRDIIETCFTYHETLWTKNGLHFTRAFVCKARFSLYIQPYVVHVKYIWIVLMWNLKRY